MTSVNGECVFCKMVRGEIAAQEVYRDDDLIAIKDIKPQAPTHVLVIPVKHARNLHDAAGLGDDALLGKLFARAGEIGRAAGPSGYRVVVNEGADGGQTVFHLHVHVLAGRAMGWPPF